MNLYKIFEKRLLVLEEYRKNSMFVDKTLKSQPQHLHVEKKEGRISDKTSFVPELNPREVSKFLFFVLKYLRARKQFFEAWQKM